MKANATERPDYQSVVITTFYLIQNFWKFKWFTEKSDKKDVTTAWKTLLCIFVAFLVYFNPLNATVALI